MLLKRFGLRLYSSFEDEPAGVGNPDLSIGNIDTGRAVRGWFDGGRPFLGRQQKACRDQQRPAGANNFG